MSENSNQFIGTDPERYSVSVPKSLEKALVIKAVQKMITVEELLTEIIQNKINWPPRLNMKCY